MEVNCLRYSYTIVPLNGVCMVLPVQKKGRGVTFDQTRL